MALCLIAVAVGLFVGLAVSLAQGGALEPSTFALLGLVVILLGQGTTPYVHPFGVGLLLGLVYDTLEDGWYGSAVARSARFSYRARLFLKSTTADWARRHLRSGEPVNGPALGQDVEEVPRITSTLLGRFGRSHWRSVGETPLVGEHHPP
jgi:xanthosine utilization system XapX-like protein